MNDFDEDLERILLGSEMGAVGQLLMQERQHMHSESDPERLAEARGQIRALKIAEHPVVRLVFPEGPHEHKLAYRPWADVPEPAKLSMLQDLVDWSGISNREMAHILLGELDVGKLTTGQRDLLIRLAEPRPTQEKMTLADLKRFSEGRNGHPKAKARELER